MKSSTGVDVLPVLVEVEAILLDAIGPETKRRRVLGLRMLRRGSIDVIRTLFESCGLGVVCACVVLECC